VCPPSSPVAPVSRIMLLLLLKVADCCDGCGCCGCCDGCDCCDGCGRCDCYGFLSLVSWSLGLLVSGLYVSWSLGLLVFWFLFSNLSSQCLSSPFQLSAKSQSVIRHFYILHLQHPKVQFGGDGVREAFQVCDP